MLDIIATYLPWAISLWLWWAVIAEIVNEQKEEVPHEKPES